MKNPLFAGATLALSLAGVAGAQSAQNQPASSAKPSAYGTSASGSSYQGVANPADEPIVAGAATGGDQPSHALPAPQSVTPTIPRQSATTTPQNPDAGIVETPVADAVSTPAPAPVLHSHVPSINPDADIVTTVPELPNQLREGTPFHARLTQELSAETVTPGTPFTAQLTESVVHMGTVVIPSGSYIHGRVTYVSAGRRIGGASVLRLRPEEVVLPDGTHYFFTGVVTATAGSDTRTNAEGEVVAKGHPIRTASELGMTTGSGAILGAVVAGPVGATVGAGIGAGVMTVHWLRQHNAAVLPEGSSVTFALSSSLQLTSAMPEAAVSSAVGAPAVTAPVSAYAEPKVVN